MTRTEGEPLTPAAGDVVGVALLDKPPAGAPPVKNLWDRFYDVYLSSTPGTAPDEILIRFHGDFTPRTTVYVWRDWGMWLEADDHGVNLEGGFAWVKISAASTPALQELPGMVIGLVEPARMLGIARPITPPIASVSMGLLPFFVWNDTPTATGYDLQLVRDTGQASLFAEPMLEIRAAGIQYQLPDPLEYGSAYIWRVRAVSPDDTGNWTVSFFTTEAEPALEPEPPPLFKFVTPEPPPVPEDRILQVPKAPGVRVTPVYLLWSIVVVELTLVICIIVFAVIAPPSRGARRYE